MNGRIGGPLVGQRQAPEVIGTRNGPGVDTKPRASLVRAWSVLTGLLAVGVFTQSIHAGVLLAGEGWGRAAHGITALGLVAVALIASVVAALTLRGVSGGGGRLAVLLFGLAVALAVQTVVGRLSAEGTNLLWLHVPLGVALVGVDGAAGASCPATGSMRTHPAQTAEGRTTSAVFPRAGSPASPLIDVSVRAATRRDTSQERTEPMITEDRIAERRLAPERPVHRPTSDRERPFPEQRQQGPPTSNEPGLLWRVILVLVGFGVATVGWLLVLTVILSFIGLPLFIFGLALMQAQES